MRLKRIFKNSLSQATEFHFVSDEVLTATPTRKTHLFILNELRWCF